MGHVLEVMSKGVSEMDRGGWDGNRGLTTRWNESDIRFGVVSTGSKGFSSSFFSGALPSLRSCSALKASIKGVAVRIAVSSLYTPSVPHLGVCVKHLCCWRAAFVADRNAVCKGLILSLGAILR